MRTRRHLIPSLLRCLLCVLAGSLAVAPTRALADTWTRIYGENAYDTMQACVQADNTFEDNRGGTVIAAIAEGGFSHVVIVGGTGVVPEAVEAQLAGYDVIRLAGHNAIDTSAEIAKWEVGEQGMTTAHMAVATGQGYWDALAGAPLVGAQNSVLVLVNENQYQAIDAVYSAGDGKVSSGYVLGGTMAVSDATWNHLF